MDSEVFSSPEGPYLNLTGRFPEGIYAYFLLKGHAGVSPEEIARFLAGRGHEVSAVHRVDQVHSARVVESEETPCEADAILCRRPGEAVRVVVADCVPLLLASGDGTAVAAVHAGWRGTLGRIAEAALSALGSDPEKVVAFLGPSVGPCCYRVDASRHARFREAFGGVTGPSGADGADRLDLAAINAARLAARGVRPERLHRETRCTSCDVALCCSYRRDGERAGRMAAVIGREA